MDSGKRDLRGEMANRPVGSACRCPSTFVPHAQGLSLGSFQASHDCKTKPRGPFAAQNTHPSKHTFSARCLCATPRGRGGGVLTQEEGAARRQVNFRRRLEDWHTERSARGRARCSEQTRPDTHPGFIPSHHNFMLSGRKGIERQATRQFEKDPRYKTKPVV